jgi:hypothetical protein
MIPNNEDSSTIVLTSLPAGYHLTTNSWQQQTLNYLLKYSKFCYHRRSVCPAILMSNPHLGLQDQIFITARQLRVSWCGAPSLTIGRICRLQLLLVSPAQSFSVPSPAGLMTVFYCHGFETPPQTWRTRSPYLYHPGTGWPPLYSQALASLFVASYDSQGYCGGIESASTPGSPTLNY